MALRTTTDFSASVWRVCFWTYTPQTIKISIHNFPAKRSTLKGQYEAFTVLEFGILVECWRCGSRFELLGTFAQFHHLNPEHSAFFRNHSDPSKWIAHQLFSRLFSTLACCKSRGWFVCGFTFVIHWQLHIHRFLWKTKQPCTFRTNLVQHMYEPAFIDFALFRLLLLMMN